MSDVKAEVLREEGLTVEVAVDKLYQAFESQFEQFDTILARAIDQEMVDEFMQGYAALRESGFNFDDAFLTAAQELNLDEDEEDDDSTGD